jgi:hypothetical protein
VIEPGLDPELIARRDRLIERFAVMQSGLGGLYYEMAIRDHLRHDVLARKAAELQRVDIELAQVERMLRGEDALGGEACPSCGTLAGRADIFCAQCGHVLHSRANGTAP